MICTVRTLLVVDTEAQAENKICHRSAKNPFVVVVWKSYKMSLRWEIFCFRCGYERVSSIAYQNCQFALISYLYLCI